MVNVDAEYLAIPLESVLTVTVLYFLPVKTFNANLTLGIAFLVLLLTTLTWKFFPDAYVVDSLLGVNVAEALWILMALNFTGSASTMFHTTLALAEYVPGANGIE